MCCDWKHFLFWQYETEHTWFDYASRPTFILFYILLEEAVLTVLSSQLLWGWQHKELVTFKFWMPEVWSHAILDAYIMKPAITFILHFDFFRYMRKSPSQSAPLYNIMTFLLFSGCYLRNLRKLIATWRKQLQNNFIQMLASLLFIDKV